MSERVKTKLQEPWKIQDSPFEVYNMDHGPLTHHIVSGNTMIAALYVDHDSVEANHLRAAPALVEALEAAVARLEAYAEQDQFAKMNGYGCMGDPDGFVDEEVKKAEAALSLAYGETQ